MMGKLPQLFCLESCREPPCGPTNIHLELMARNRKHCQANKNLINSTFRWETDTTGTYVCVYLHKFIGLLYKILLSSRVK